MSVVLLQLSIGRFGNSRKGDLELVEAEADKSLLKLSKVLLDSPEYEDVVEFDGRVRKWIAARSAPSFFKEGIYQVKAGAVPDLAAFLTEQAAAREVLVEKLVEAYAQRQAEARMRLRDQWREQDYPPAGVLRSKFSLRWQFMEFAAPGAVRGVNAELFEAEKRKLEEAFDSARQMACALTREKIKGIVDHMVERLTPGPDGKRKTFKAGTVENLREFVTTFPFRDVTNDEELAAEVQRLGKLLEGVNPQALRDSEQARSAFVGGLTTLQATLAGLVTEAPLRAVNLED